MVNLVEFLAGQQYKNRKGIYKVLDVQGDAMRIRWENGEDVDTTVTLQSHIIERMQDELKRLTQGKVASLIKGSAAPNGWHRILR